MRPGIILQHSIETSPASTAIRNDVTAFLGVIPKARWPKGVSAGEFVELSFESHEELLLHPGRELFDPVTRQAIGKFFENGGAQCRLIGVIIESEADLTVDDPFTSVFLPVLEHLRGEEDVGLLAMPVLSHLPILFDGDKATVPCEPVWRMLLEHCREMNNRFLIVDTPRELHGEPLVRWVSGFRKRAGESSAFGAIYYPWLMQGDDTFPPSGCMAGVYARLEQQHAPFGVRWPPANELLHGVTQPAVELRWKEGGDLTEASINPILVQPSRGTVVWGARTLSTDPRWLHINSRRIVSFISEQLRRDADWAVFENHTPDLRKILERIVSTRLDQLWHAGLLTGDQAGSDYLVRCDEEVNPQKVRDAGGINVVVTLRPISTAEFVVVELRLGADVLANGALS